MPSSLIDDAPEGVNTPEFSVSEISGAVKRMIEGEFARVRVRGEIGRVSQPRSGHIYLDLKDDRAVLAAVVWKGAAGKLGIQPREGDEVIAEGRLTTFAGQSKYQLVIERLAYAGEGALLARLERLRKALAAEGLFDDARKRPIPYLPRVIGVVTSPSGAVIRDILHRLGERFPVHVLVWPVAVQGARCAPEVTAAIQGFDALEPGGPIPRPDLLIVARGGGSLEDLWGFNDEAVVRAAAACSIPLISAVGHETDTTLIDHAADLRAPTPSAAAELAVPVRSELVATVADLAARRVRAMARALAQRRQRLGDVSRALPRPEQILAERRQRLDVAVARLPRPAEMLKAWRDRLELHVLKLKQGLSRRTQSSRVDLARQAGRFSPRLLSSRTGRLRDRFDALARLHGSLHYREALKRGYAMVRAGVGGGAGALLTRAAEVAPGAALEIQFADGRVGATATTTKPAEAPPRPRKRKAAPRGGRDDGGGAQGSLF
ncbi:MAG: exodeoxyribonuclease VII large subunit [Proteobacteria bacterium]|nr:exodeoxyribonuclease VII large subunit [Pseudomonadota bacterium]